MTIYTPSIVQVPMAPFQIFDCWHNQCQHAHTVLFPIPYYLSARVHATEQAFLRHIKSLYISRGCGVGVTIRNAHGKGPDHVVDYAIGQCRNAAYDRVVTLLDTDLLMSAAAHRRARSKKIHIIGSTPCIEGLLLKILDEYVPETSTECKQRCGGVLPEQLTAPRRLSGTFSRRSPGRATRCGY